MIQTQTQTQPAPVACADLLDEIMAATVTQTPDPLARARAMLAQAQAEMERARREMGEAQAQAEKAQAQAVRAQAKAQTRQPATAQAQAQATLAATPKMLRGGTWGARVVDGAPTPKVGDKVSIVTRTGKRWTGYVTQTWGRTFAYSRAPKAKATPERTCRVCGLPRSRWGADCF